MKPEDLTAADGLSAEERELLAHLLASDAVPGPPRIVPIATGDPAPLSSSQRQLWILDQLRPGDAGYHLSVAFRAVGRLDLDALTRALTAVVARHDILRTTFEVIEDEPRQRVNLPAPVAVPVTNSAGTDDPDGVEAAKAEGRAPFDLARGPLFRARVLRLAEDRHVLILTMHHIVSDGWSMDLLYRELALHYDACRSGRTAAVAELPVQYRDFAAWQRTWLKGEVLNRLVTYWRKQLDGVVPLRLPVDRLRNSATDTGGAQEVRRLDRAAVVVIDALARRERATRFMAMFAAFSALLARYGGTGDVVVGSPMAGRDRAEVASLIGVFVNLLPLRATMGERTTFRDLVRQVRDTTLAAYEHQDLPFDVLADALRIEKPSSGNAVFQVTFSAQDVLAQPLELSDLRLEPLEVPTVCSRFDLEAHVLDDPAGLRIGFVYNTGLFDAATIRRMLTHYTTLLRACVSDPDQPILAHALLSGPELADSPSLWNRTDRDAVRSERIPRLVGEQASRTPDAVAVADGPMRLTYGELDRRASQWAHWLRQHDVRAETTVGVLLDRSTDLAVAQLAVLRSGAAYVPLDPGYPRERLAHMVADAGVRLVLTDNAHRQLLAEDGPRAVCLDADVQCLSGLSTLAPDIVIDPDQLAYVVYTSGSTGTPKGVGIPHAGLENLVQWHNRAFGVTAADRASLVASVGFDASAWELWPYLAAGACVLVIDAEARSAPDRLWAWLQSERVSMAFLPTPLAEAALRERVPRNTALRYLLTGGDRLRTSSGAECEFSFVNNYGPTENTVVSTSCVVEPVSAEGFSPSIGRPIDNVCAYVLDAQMTQLPIGVTGELYIGGKSLARGYLGRAAQSAERFVPDPFSGVPGSRLYRTGDLVRWRAHGALDFIGRRDGQVKIRGFRIELGEVEAALMRLPGVHTAVAAVRRAGEDYRLVGYLVPAPGSALDVDALRDRLRRQLPEYMVPAAMVQMDALPLTANGKVDRNALPEPVYERAADVDGTPRTPVEETLVRIWSEVLRLERVGIYDNFFDVGGDSVLSIQIASRASRAGIRLSPRQFFEHQTIAELAAANVGDAAAPAPQGRVAGPVPLTSIQRWFFDQEQPRPDHFCQSVLLDVSSDITIDGVRTALASLVAHHDALRSRFVRDGVSWRQEIAEADPPPSLVESEELAGLSQEGQSSAIERSADRLQRSLQLAEGRIFQAAWFTRGEGRRNRLLLVLHHLVVDAVSWRILIEDLQTALDSRLAGRPVLLPPKTTSFQQWSHQLRDRITAGALESERAFWDRHAAAAFEPLPVDANPSLSMNTVGRSVRVASSLTPAETGALLRDVPRACGARANEVLITAVVCALHRWSGNPSIRIDVEGHGRQDAMPGIDLSRTVGWFTVLYPLTLQAASAGDVWAALSNVRDAVRSVPFGGLGYGLLRDGTDAALRRVLGSRSEVSVNYLGHIDQAVPGSGVIALAAGSAGSEIGAENRRPYLLEVNARVFDGRLEMSWTFCPALHARGTVDWLASTAMDAVRTVIAEATHAPRAALHTGAFPLARLDEPQFGRIAARYDGAVIEDIYPLTPLQHGMLVHSLARPGTGAFVTQIELVLDGDINSGALRTAWWRLQQRHAILRTGCSDVGGGEFRQVVVASPPLPWIQHDWSLEPEHDANARLGVLLDDERHRGFGLDEAPLMRLSLVEVRPRRFHLVWTHHHALLDGWSVAMLLEELVHLYEACLEGREPPEERRPGYRDYAQWLLGRKDDDGPGFWRRFLGGFTTPTRLSVDQAPHAGARLAGDIVERERWIDSALTRSLADSAARQRLTLNTVVQGAWALLLSRYSGESDVVFGTAVAGRPADLAGVERMVGLFLNGLPMRVAVHHEQPMAAWLAAIQRDHVELRQHEHDALSDIQEWSEVPLGQPLFETTLAFENYPVAATLDVATRRMGIIDFRLTAHTGAALHLRVVPGDRLRLMISHDRERFDDRTVEEMLAQLEAVFEQFVARPDMPVGLVSLRTSAHTSLAGDRVGPQSPDWTRGAVHEQIVQRARLAPDQAAIAHESGIVTYRELDAGSNRLAHALRAIGVRRGQVVAVHAPRGDSLVVALLGVLRAGAAFTILDPAYPAPRLIEQVQIADAALILHAGSRREVPETLTAWERAGVGRRLLSLDAVPEVSAGEAICEATGPDDLAYVAFTSGSSGQPKAVLGQHEALAHYARWLHDRWSLGAVDRISMLSALAHDPLLRDIFPPLQLGATLCIPDSDRFGSPGALSAWMAASGVTCANLTPAMAQLLLEGGDATRLDTLRLVLFVGEALPLTLVERFRARAPIVTCINLYGATETQQALAHFVVPPGGVVGTNGIAPVGSGLPGVQLLVRRPNGERAGAGEVGDVWMWSRLIARGYLGDPALTGERFVDDPFGPGTGRAYHTGDRGRLLPGGDVLVLGRGDDLVKIRGFRVEPGEIEAFLSRQPDVREVVVIAGHDHTAQTVLAAYVTGAALPSELRARMRAQFPEYMVPARITRLEQMPRTPTGKLNRLALASRVEETPATRDRYVAPRTPVEHQMAGIWASLLRVDRVGISDTFFELGGHSIVAARLVAQVRDTFGVELRIADVFERPGLAELSALVSAGVDEQEEIVSQLADEIRGLSPEELRSFLEAGFGTEPTG